VATLGRDAAMRPLGIVGVSLACVALTLCFLALGFPYDQLAERLASELESGTGLRVRYASVDPYVSLRGPGLEARDAVLEAPQAAPLAFERMRLRPAWSLAWLRLTPAFHLDGTGPAGSLAGVVTLGSRAGFEGDLAGVDLNQLPVRALWPGATLSGTLDARVAVHRGNPLPEGEIELAAREGNLAAPGLGLAIPFDELTGKLDLGDGAYVRVRSLRSSSPLFSADADGEIAAAPSFAEAPLDLRVQIQADPRFGPLLRRLGLGSAEDGRTNLRLQGTASAPQVRERPSGS